MSLDGWILKNDVSCIEHFFLVRPVMLFFWWMHSWKGIFPYHGDEYKSGINDSKTGITLEYISCAVRKHILSNQSKGSFNIPNPSNFPLHVLIDNSTIEFQVELN